MKHLAVIVALLGSVAACGKKDDKGGAAAKTEEGAPAAGPVKSTPKDLFATFTDPKADGMALLDKFHDGTTFSGKVAVKGAEETGKPILWIDIDGKNHMSLDYKDVAQAKAVKDGDTVTVTCKIGGASGTLMMMLDCANAK
jgi:hypothetical protein